MQFQICVNVKVGDRKGERSHVVLKINSPIKQNNVRKRKKGRGRGKYFEQESCSQKIYFPPVKIKPRILGVPVGMNNKLQTLAERGKV